jgi:hypothetical protein
MNDRDRNLFNEMLTSYPPEKRELAKEIFHRFADGDSGNFFTQLFLVLDVYAHYAEHVPTAMVEANRNAIQTIEDMRKEIEMLTTALEQRDLSISNHAERTDELCQMTIAKCNETVSKIELMLKNIGSQMDTKAIAQGIKSVIEATINRDVIEPFLKRTQELSTEVIPALKEVREVSAQASRSWTKRIYTTAIWHVSSLSVIVALAVGIILYVKFNDYFERRIASRIIYAEQLINDNQDAFKQLAIAQQPIKVMRTQVNGFINQGYALELPGADAVETRVEDGQTNAYVYFTSSVIEQDIRKMQEMTEELQKENQQFNRTNAPH